MIQFLKNTQTDDRKKGGTNPISWNTSIVDWHLKVKDIKYNVDLTTNYCITRSMQKVSSINKLVLKVQQIIESCENKLPRPPINH